MTSVYYIVSENLSEMWVKFTTTAPDVERNATTRLLLSRNLYQSDSFTTNYSYGQHHLTLS
jgi:hypothetical protein